MRYPKRIRLPRETYTDPNMRFHLIFRTHPTVGRLSSGIREALWPTVLEQRDDDRIQLLAACLMPDHLHLLAGPARLDVIAFCDAFKSWTTRLAWAAGHQGPLWQPSMYDVGVRDERHFEAAAAYVVGNPVRAGLCEDVRAWPHSWAYWWEE